MPDWHQLHELDVWLDEDWYRPAGHVAQVEPDTYCPVEHVVAMQVYCAEKPVSWYTESETSCTSMCRPLDVVVDGADPDACASRVPDVVEPSKTFTKSKFDSTEKLWKLREIVLEVGQVRVHLQSASAS